MAAQESHPVRNGIIATVVGGVILAVLAELWPPAKTALVWLWGKLLAFLGLFSSSYPVPGWLIVLLGLLALVTVFRILAGLRSVAVSEALHANYIEDILFGAKWRWSWASHQIHGLWCFCPSCDAELVYDDSSVNDIYRRDKPKTEFICEHCGHRTVGVVEGGNKSYALSAVQREIRRRVRTGQYPGAPSPSNP